jgi:ankyrin repeat protein
MEIDISNGLPLAIKAYSKINANNNIKINFNKNKLIQTIIDKNKLNEQNKSDGKSILMIAVNNGDAARNSKGYTPLMEAVLRKDTDAIKKLVEYGAKIDEVYFIFNR